MVQEPRYDAAGRLVATDLLVFSSRRLVELATVEGEEPLLDGAVIASSSGGALTAVHRPSALPALEDSGVLAAGLRRAAAGAVGALEGHVGGREMVVAYRPLNGTPWVTAAVADGHEVYAAVHHQARSLAMAGFVLLLGGGGLTAAMMRRIGRRMVEQAERLGALAQEHGILIEHSRDVVYRQGTARRRAEEALARSALAWSHAMEFVEEAICLLDNDGRIVRANRAFFPLFATTPEAATGKAFIDTVCPLADHRHCPGARALARRRNERTVLEPQDPHNSSGRAQELSLRFVGGEGTAAEGIVLAIRDLTRQRATENELRLAASVFENSLDGVVIADARRRIVKVNPTFTALSGYPVAEAAGMSPSRLLHPGDGAQPLPGHLVPAAPGGVLAWRAALPPQEWHGHRHLVECPGGTGRLREEDTVGRLGGDEFTIILENVTESRQAGIVAEMILENIARRYTVVGQEIFASASIGIALFPADGTDGDTLLKNADTAMYRSKALGRNAFRFYTAEMTADARERLAMEVALRYAVPDGEMSLSYPPQVDCRTGEVVGAEALRRWRNGVYGEVLPGRFIPLAEDARLIRPLGEGVLETACRQLKAWQRGSRVPRRVVVNVSARQLEEWRFVEHVLGVLQRTGLEPRHLELEIAEGLLMESRPRVVGLLAELAAAGVRIAVDDFGTGYSWPGYLKRFPIDRIKIDRSFVQDIPRDRDDEAIAAAIIAMGRSPGAGGHRRGSGDPGADGVSARGRHRYCLVCVVRSRSCAPAAPARR